MAIVDFHSHILPGMDDGSKNSEMSLQMLQMARNQGVEAMIASSHFYASQNSPETFLKRRQVSLNHLYSHNLDGLPRVIPGAEVAFFSGIGRADGMEQLCVGSTNLMLLEMPFCAWSSRTIYEVELLLNRGIRPIMAHLERFYSLQKDKHMIDALLELPVYVQINAQCLLSWSSRHRALRLFQNQDAHFLGSDCHNLTSRPPNYGAGRAILERKLGSQVLARMDRLASAILGI